MTTSLLPPRLTERWTTQRYHATQSAYWHSPHRFNVVPAGRRSGKTERAKRKLIKRALRGTKFPGARFFAAAPTRDQAKRIYWDDLKRMIPAHFMAGKPSESELVIRLINASELHVLGMDKPERFEGSPWDGGVLDEFANMKPQAWQANVRPALSDRQGWCDLIGVPEGRNHYYDQYKLALAEVAERGNASEWGAFTWKSSDILPASEIAAAKRDLDPLTFEQEYEASFVNFVGRAYYPFDEAVHCAKLSHLYNPNAPLVIMFDFNVDPGVAAIAQEVMLPGGLLGTAIIGEVWIPANSNTPAVCRKIVSDWGEHRGLVICFGDATGGAEGSAKVEGSDWALVKKHLAPTFKGRLLFEVPESNPRERVRVNAVNSRLRSADGLVRLMVDPHKAGHVVKDLEGVRLLEGGAGEIDKKRDPKLTHISDAVGYYIAKMFPLERRVSTVSTYRM